MNSIIIGTTYDFGLIHKIFLENMVFLIIRPTLLLQVDSILLYLLDDVDVVLSANLVSI